MIMIQTRGVRKSFGNQVVLDGIDLDVSEGTTCALLGPNGAGKTTMVRILSTLIRADAGEARVAGHDLAREPEAVRAAIGVTGQFSAVDNLLTGEENLRLMADLHHLDRREGRRRAAELLGRFDLVDAARKLPATYSGGMRRRLDLGASLVGSPQLLLLDEPTTGLDPRSRSELWVALEELVAQGTDVLLTTQYLEEADRLADRITVVDHGRVIAEGTSAELKARMGGAVIEVRMADAEGARAAQHALSGVGDGELSRQGEVVQVPATDGTIVLSEVVRRLDAAHLTARGLQLREPSLDDVFLALTGHDAKSGVEPDAADHVGDAGDAPPSSGESDTLVNDSSGGRA